MRPRPVARLKALCRNESCWREGDVFSAYRDNRAVYVRCRAEGGSQHYLLDEDYEEVSDPRLCPDFAVVSESSQVQPGPVSSGRRR